jgi:hypothetical protein
MNVDDDDYHVELSPLSRPYSENGKSVEVEIYKGEDDEGWILEILDTKGNSMIAEEMFKTDKEAWDQFIMDVKEDGIEAFIRKD